ncbi:helix-turn-helix domain-containing protein [Acetobacterium wieringae]|uniref:Helix-turn-helix domain-containing protein n=1 Tax=Acetobacterium wieringae TaxID=52694 RepID=A0ABY6HJ05_9FIRM|nr:helix-turn-helix domain-containing protein [Acetobacterium wieringae]UYO64367.1 helix-turn-helix domain-containing protein [Acetobacterium wieringae]VUZ27144.1 Uncharacterised protein [Acetobacterium wieringae]
MELALSILMDELAVFEPVLLKALSTKTKFRQVHFFQDTLTETDNKTLYIADATSFLNSRTVFPANLIVIGDELSSFKLEHVDTLMQIPSGVDRETVMQRLFDVYNIYNHWDQRMLTAILENIGIEEFLKIAAENLDNPIALFDNSLTVIATAGSFLNSAAGTIWEKINIPGYPLADFFTLQEQQELSVKMLKQVEEPYLYHPVFDQRHTYASTHIWIDQKLCGNLGLVDINAPFTEGQLRILWHITERLTRYFKSNDAYIHIAENQTHFIKHLIEDQIADEKSIIYHLKRFGLKRYDDYYLLCFVCPMTSSSEIESMSFVKRINQYYYGSIISVYDQQIILILSEAVYPIQSQEEQTRMAELLLKYEMNCGISICFHDFLQLRHYYVQSRFAAEISLKSNNENQKSFCFYEACYQEHLVELLSRSVELPVICEPEILKLKNFGEEHEIELIHCLRVYLQHGRNLSSTAKELNLHRNTLIYRIDKIGRILKLDLSHLSEEKNFFLIFSCMVAETICD